MSKNTYATEAARTIRGSLREGMLGNEATTMSRGPTGTKLTASEITVYQGLIRFTRKALEGR